MDAYYERNYSSDGAHKDATTRGRNYKGPNLSPRFDEGSDAETYGAFNLP
jgi:hypothetical protein